MLQNKDEELEHLEKQKSLQEDLAKAQFEQLMLKQRQLQLLEAKLAALEAMENERENANNSIENIVDDLHPESPHSVQPSASVINGASANQVAKVSSSVTLIDEVEDKVNAVVAERAAQQAQQDFMSEMMSNPDFKEKIMVLQRQSQELTYLEDQLSSLKDLKQKMLEKQELMTEITKEQETLFNAERSESDAQTMALMEKVEEILAPEQDAVVAASSKEEPNVLEPLGPNTSNLDELEAATNAMDRYLTFQQEQREKFNKEPSPEDLSNEAQILESLMQRLMNASVYEDKNYSVSTENAAETATPVSTHHVTFSNDLKEIEPPVPQPEQEEEEEEDGDVDMEAAEDIEEDIEGDDLLPSDTSSKIELAIKQLSGQIEEVKAAEELISTPDERTYFDTVLSKMTSQLEELLELREKVAYYEELIVLTQQEQKQGEESFATIEGVAIAAEDPIPTFVFKAETLEEVAVEQQLAEEVEQEESQAEDTVRVERESVFIHEEAIVNSKNGESKIPSSSTYVPFPSNTRELREYKPSLHSQILMKSAATRPPSSVADSSSRKSTSASTRSKKLFQKHKMSIYQSASSLIESFETKPHFLLSLFKKLHQLADSEVSQQQLLLLVDELVEENHLEQLESSIYADSNEEIDTESELLKSISKSARLEKDSLKSARNHLQVGIQTYVASMVISNPSFETFAPNIIQDISNHVCALLYQELTFEQSFSPEAALKMIEDDFKPILGSVVSSFSGLAVKDCWGRLIDDLFMFVCQCLDWTEAKTNTATINADDADVIVVQAWLS